MGTSGGQWLLSEKSSRLFLVSSIVVLTVYTLLVLLGALSGPLGLAALKDSPIALTAGIAVPAIAVPASFIILVGMLWYWVRFDDSRRFVKLLWLASFLALGWYSMSIYYFVVYRRQRRLAVSGNQ
jgi:hypothetical protein